MKSVILVGMPGAGKSTVGVLLAKELGLNFVDTDLLIQAREGKTLQRIMDAADYLDLRRIEEEILLAGDFTGMVVATGGSAIYSAKGMQRLQQLGQVVYLDCSIEQLKQRIHNYETRGIAKHPQQSFAELVAERQVLYQQYADIRMDTEGLNPGQVVEQLVQALS